MNRRAVLWVFVAFCLGSALASCASDHQQGDETHFQTCASNTDCESLGPNYRCEARRCMVTDAGANAGGRGGSGGVAPEGGVVCEGPGGAPGYPQGGGCNSPGGAIGYVGCRGFFDSGLRSIACSPDGGAGGPPLVGLCDHMNGVGDLFVQRIIFDCVQGNLHMVHGEFGPREGAPGGGGWASFDVPKLCAPDAKASLRRCANTALPCPRPPMCTAEGSFGCDDIVASCPALSSAACHNGFDTRDYAARDLIRECLGSDAGDCVDAFYRCAWGL